MKLIYPGQFVRTTLLSNRFSPIDGACHFCRSAPCGPYWFHYPTRAVVCDRCMSDPWGKTGDGEEGIERGQQLLTAYEVGVR